MSDVSADSVVSITVKGTVDHMLIIVSDDEPGHPNKLWQAMGPPGFDTPLLPSSTPRIIGRVLDVHEYLPDGRTRRTLWRLP